MLATFAVTVIAAWPMTDCGNSGTELPPKPPMNVTVIVNN
jgi:hypothetical protein